jgi:hypothetical protein
MLDHASSAASRQEPGAHVYQRPPEPVYFPSTERVPETKHHLERRTALYQSIKRELASSASIGCDQFVYWDPTTAKKRLAPDVFVRLGAADHLFETWKTWERGAPDLGVEIVSDSDQGQPEWKGKIDRYRAAGIREVVRFQPKDRRRPLRIWDAIDGDVVERAQSDPNFHACETLGLWWVVVKDPSVGPMLRLSRDREGHDLLPTPDEVAVEERAENEQLRAEMEALRAQLGKAQLGKAKTKKRKPR